MAEATKSAVIISEWPKNSRGEIVRVAVDQYRGAPTISVRVWWPNGAELAPGRNGVNLAIQHLPALAAALTAALTEARARGLLPTDSNDGGAR